MALTEVSLKEIARLSVYNQFTENEWKRSETRKLKLEL